MRRQAQGQSAVLSGLLKQFAARILPFDTSAARRYADLAVNARASGGGVPMPDGCVAAIASGLVVIDAWTAAS